jgi:hypothetical protein
LKEDFMVQPYKTDDEPISLREAMVPGLISGVIGAVLMGLALMFFAAAIDGDPFQPWRLIAATFLRESAFPVTSDVQPGTILFGVALHFVTAILFGIFFAWIGGYLSVSAAMEWGVIFGLAVWVIMQFGILPVINPYLAAMPPAQFAIAHIFFGISLGLYPRFLAASQEVPQVQRKAA